MTGPTEEAYEAAREAFVLAAYRHEAVVDAVWPLAFAAGVAEGRRLRDAEMADRYFALLDTADPVDALWGAALDASHSRDFRNEDGELNEDAYLHYKLRATTKAREAVLAEGRRFATPPADQPNTEDQ